MKPFVPLCFWNKYKLDSSNTDAIPDLIVTASKATIVLQFWNKYK